MQEYDLQMWLAVMCVEEASRNTKTNKHYNKILSTVETTVATLTEFTIDAPTPF